MIKYNNNTINDWNFGDDNIIKVYKHGAVCYYKITSGDTPTPVQEPCYAVVDDITQYSDTEFEDVFNKADGKWYKLNNLSQYEEYGVYGSGRTITTYEGKLTIDEETIPSPSRLPSGYTEVEYIRQNSNYNAYINTNVLLFDDETNSYTVTTRLASEFHSNLGCATIISAEVPVSPYYGMGYRYKCSSTVDQLEFFGGDSNYSSSVVDNGDGTRTVTFQSTGNTSWTSNAPLSLLCSFSDTSFTTPFRYADATIYSSTIVKNGATVRDFVPAKRDSDDKYGLYDLITDTFFTSPNGNNFSGGSEVNPPSTTATCEFIYSGSSWVNVGEVSGSSITIKSPEYIEKDSSHNGKINLDYVWKTNSKMQFKFYSTNNGGGSVIGEEGAPDNNDCRIFFASTTAYFDWGSSRLSWSSNGKTNTLYEYEYGNYYIKNMVTSASTNTGSTISTSRTNPLYLGIGSNDRFRTYYLKFYDGDTLVKDFIPWTDMNGNYGLFDKVSLSVYNVASGTLTGSSNVTDVEVGGGYEYPIEYTVMQDPPNNISFSSMAEAQAYECPWVGMKATINGVSYTFSGNSQSGYEWVQNTSRLPSGYTEVEYIDNSQTSSSSAAYINTAYYPNNNTRVVCDFQYIVGGQHRRLLGSGEWNDSAASYLVEAENYMTSSSPADLYLRYGYNNSSWLITNEHIDMNRHTIDFNKNLLYMDNVLVYTCPTNTFTCTYPIALFGYIANQGFCNGYNNYFMMGRIYSCQIYDNGTLVRDFVPCTRDSDSKAGMYDIVNDVFYTSPNSYNFTAGDPI